MNSVFLDHSVFVFENSLRLDINIHNAEKIKTLGTTAKSFCPCRSKKTTENKHFIQPLHLGKNGLFAWLQKENQWFTAKHDITTSKLGVQARKNARTIEKKNINNPQVSQKYTYTTKYFFGHSSQKGKTFENFWFQTPPICHLHTLWNTGGNHN